jgi:succinate-semialdehyde dehydrogenase/glutarate-semialdehyde dehydrogenase
MSIASINPATGEELKTFDEASADEIDEALAAAASAFLEWRRLSFTERAGFMTRAAADLRANARRYAELITLEMGKPIKQAVAEIEKCAWNCDYFAENAEHFLAEEPAPSDAAESYVRFQPLGPVLAVMPWNFPFWQLFRFAAPGLMAGNVAILKHASNVPQCSLAIEEVFRNAGAPEGVFKSLLVSGEHAQALIDDPRVVAVTLTGSDATGSKIAEVSGRALKPSVLELGGSDPFIVLEDADIEEAASVGARARNQNAGQSCIAAKRFIVAESVADSFVAAFCDAVGRLKVGDPMDESVDVGPLARPDLLDALESQVRRSEAAGAKVAVGGSRIADGGGNFFQPTVLTDVTREMPVFREETFGPVAAVIRARDEAEAVGLANDSPYGLGSALWTRDIERGRRLAADIEAGSVFINGMVASDPRLPFGGIKRSGFGRELSHYGIKEFVNIQTVWVGPAEGATVRPDSE